MTPLAYPHVRALTAALAGVGVPVHVGGPPSPLPARPYVVIHPTPGDLSASSLAGDLSNLDLPLIATVVADGWQQALDWADRVRDRLLSTPVSVAGRANVRVAPDGTGPGLQRDDDVSPPLWYVAAPYRVQSTA